MKTETTLTISTMERVLYINGGKRTACEPVPVSDMKMTSQPMFTNLTLNSLSVLLSHKIKLKF